MSDDARRAAVAAAARGAEEPAEHYIVLWVRETIALMVPRPALVTVRGVIAGALRDTLIVEVSPSDENIGVLLGKGGETINALRQIAKRFGQREHIYTDIKVLAETVEADARERARMLRRQAQALLDEARRLETVRA